MEVGTGQLNVYTDENIGFVTMIAANGDTQTHKFYSPPGEDPLHVATLTTVGGTGRFDGVNIDFQTFDIFDLVERDEIAETGYLYLTYTIVVTGTITY